jgi:hypothetical protein
MPVQRTLDVVSVATPAVSPLREWLPPSRGRRMGLGLLRVLALQTEACHRDGLQPVCGDGSTASLADAERADGKLEESSVDICQRSSGRSHQRGCHLTTSALAVVAFIT